MLCNVSVVTNVHVADANIWPIVNDIGSVPLITTLMHLNLPQTASVNLINALMTSLLICFECWYICVSAITHLLHTFASLSLSHCCMYCTYMIEKQGEGTIEDQTEEVKT